jgi:hypothetical protein
MADGLIQTEHISREIFRITNLVDEENGYLPMVMLLKGTMTKLLFQFKTQN